MQPVRPDQRAHRRRRPERLRRSGRQPERRRRRRTIVPVLNREVARARDAGALVVYTQDWHPPVTAHFAKDGGVWPVHCVAGTWGAELHPRLVVDGPTVRKGAERRGRLLGLHDARPGDRRRRSRPSSTRSSGRPAWSGSWSAAWRPTTVSRRPPSMRPGSATRRAVLADGDPGGRPGPRRRRPGAGRDDATPGWRSCGRVNDDQATRGDRPSADWSGRSSWRSVARRAQRRRRRPTGPGPDPQPGRDRRADPRGLGRSWPTSSASPNG